VSENNQAPPAYEQVTEGVPHKGWQLYLDQIQSREEIDCDKIVDDRPNH
jgi:hypothetical protein